MIKKVIALFALLSVAVLGVAVPASAHGRRHALRGEMDLVLNTGIGVEGNPTADVSWVGTWDIGDGRTYDIVFFSIVPPTPIGSTGWSYWVEDVALYDDGFIQSDGDGVVLPFDRDAYVMYGHDRGIGQDSVGSGYAIGRVTGVHPHLDDHHLFHRNDVGNLLTFRGALDGPTVFTGTFTVYGVG